MKNKKGVDISEKHKGSTNINDNQKNLNDKNQKKEYTKAIKVEDYFNNTNLEVNGNDEHKKEFIIKFMKEDTYKPLLIKEIATLLGVSKVQTDELKTILCKLEEEGLIFKNSFERYGIPSRMNLIVGNLQQSEKGYSFLIPLDKNIKDVFIPREHLNGSMNSDLVIARVLKNSNVDKKSEGEVIKILKRANTEIVGLFEPSRNYGFVIPDNKRLQGDIFIPKEKFNGALKGQKVVVAIEKWSDGRRSTEGRIIEVLGDKNEIGIDILSIAKSYNFRIKFPQTVIEEADRIETDISIDMMRDRVDLRNKKIITIDGDDAKDLDDAVSIEKKGENYLLGVHIADVSYFVKEDSELDKEAKSRGTSLYLVDRVIPMLPQKLSNGVCSLNPKVPRLTFSVEMEIDRLGNVVNHNIFESVIQTTERMTYDNVYKILELKDEVLLNQYAHINEDLILMFELSKILTSRREHRGSIDFDFGESKILLNNLGKPIDIKKHDITIANKIIEEFMIICNETVSEHFYWLNVPFVFRVHQKPEEQKIEKLSKFLETMGYSLRKTQNFHQKVFQELIKKVKGKSEEHIINTAILRSLSKARYSENHDIHFGLCSGYYSHFTSPIRRYPDLIIHRIMKENLIKPMSSKRRNHYKNILPQIAENCSELERLSEEAERETQDLKKAEYMINKIGENFNGIISGITSFGIFVELENSIEGLIRLSSMEDDYYVYHDTSYMIVGERTGKIYRIGDFIKVTVVAVNIEIRKVEFVIFSEETDIEEVLLKQKKSIKRKKIQNTSSKIIIESDMTKDNKKVKKKVSKNSTRKFLKKNDVKKKSKRNRKNHKN